MATKEEKWKGLGEIPLRRAAVCASAAVVLLLSESIASAGMLNQVPCPDCGATVSTRAFMCPKCGCNAAAIRQHAEAGENVARMDQNEAEVLLGPNWFGQVGRVQWMREKQALERILSDGMMPAPDAAEVLGKRAVESRLKVLKMLKIGFTLDQVYTMRHELVSAILAVRWIKSVAVGKKGDEK